MDAAAPSARGGATHFLESDCLAEGKAIPMRGCSSPARRRPVPQPCRLAAERKHVPDNLDVCGRSGERPRRCLRRIKTHVSKIYVSNLCQKYNFVPKLSRAKRAEVCYQVFPKCVMECL